MGQGGGLSPPARPTEGRSSVAARGDWPGCLPDRGCITADARDRKNIDALSHRLVNRAMRRLVLVKRSLGDQRLGQGLNFMLMYQP